jgi:hypothetical protein
MITQASENVPILYPAPIPATSRYNARSTELGEVAEWSNAPDSKSGIPVSGIEGSNPSLSAIISAR